MSVITGVSGDVKAGSTSLNEITKWSFSAETNTLRYASNKTAGKKKTLSGSSQASGSITFVYDPNVPLTTQISEGAAVTLHLVYVSGHEIVVPAIIKNFKVDVDIDNGAIVGGSCDYESNGTWTYPTALP